MASTYSPSIIVDLITRSQQDLISSTHHCLHNAHSISQLLLGFPMAALVYTYSDTRGRNAAILQGDPVTS